MDELKYVHECHLKKLNITDIDVERIKNAPLFARVCNFPSKDTPRNTLANIEDRKILFIMDSEAILENILGKKTEESLKKLGWELESIKEKSDTFNFELLLFTSKCLDEKVYLSTWENMKIVCMGQYPELSRVISKHWDTMSKIPFDDLEKEHGKSFKEKFTFKDLKSLIDEKGEESVTHTHLRHWCFHDNGMKKLFSGDGYSYDYYGNKMMKEYVTVNRYRNELKNLIITELISIWRNKVIITAKTHDGDLNSFGTVEGPYSYNLWLYKCRYSFRLCQKSYLSILEEKGRKLNMMNAQALIIQDSMSAHVDERIMKEFEMNGIPHSSHLTQPLDGTIFSSWKREIKNPNSYHIGVN